MNLARSFKAGIEGANSCHVASATIESMFQPSLTRRGLVALAVVPALKGRATFKPPPCGEEKAAQDIPRGDFLGKVDRLITRYTALKAVSHENDSAFALTVRLCLRLPHILARLSVPYRAIGSYPPTEVECHRKNFNMGWPYLVLDLPNRSTVYRVF